MSRTLPLAAGLLAGVLAASGVHAQPMPGPGMMMQDPYGDATVARKDVETQTVARFAAMDGNADGVLTADELRAARPARRGGGEGDGPPRGAGRRGDSGGPGGGPGGGMARMLDRNGDGKITRDEFVAGTLQRFDMIDANHDGQLTKAERQAAMEAMRARMEERMKAMMEGGMGGGND